MLSSILVQASPQGGGMSGILMIVAMIAIFYFVMIRPQNKKQKELKKQREAMRKGDHVVTAGGIHGRIRDIKDATVLIEVAQGVSIKVDKGSVYPAVEDTTSRNEKASKKEKEEVAEVKAENGENNK